MSTGALIAPFAFLGSRYDKDLERFYTSITKNDVMVSRGLMTALLGDSLYDSTPLLHLIRGVLTPEVIAAIGKEYSEKGRLPCVATTNLDAPVGVLWNVGGIAATGNPQAGDLMGKILPRLGLDSRRLPAGHDRHGSGGEHFQKCMSTAAPWPRSSSIRPVRRLRLRHSGLLEAGPGQPPATSLRHPQFAAGSGS